MEIQATKQYIVRIWPRALKEQKPATTALLRQMEDLRDRVSAAWKPGPSVLEEIRAERSKPYGCHD